MDMKRVISFVKNGLQLVWLVVSIILKTISQLGRIIPYIYGKKHVPNHQPDEWFVHIYLYAGRVRFVDS